MTLIRRAVIAYVVVLVALMSVSVTESTRGLSESVCRSVGVFKFSRKPPKRRSLSFCQEFRYLVFVCVCVRERERKRDREGDREREGIDG